ncbi:MAG: Rid family detoxifying hydrolase [Methanomassiliicoccales archaeon]|nr:Rid family detoxifying hydrolase [Methanomassiliicoccales archaeon]
MRSVLVEEAPQPIGPYSQAVVRGTMIFCSGQLGLDPMTNHLAAGAAEQTRMALSNLSAVLKGAGSSLSQTLKVTVYLTDLSYWNEVNQAYTEFFSPPYPARSAVQVAALPKGAIVEIDIIAFK